MPNDNLPNRKRLARSYPIRMFRHDCLSRALQDVSRQPAGIRRNSLLIDVTHAREGVLTGGEDKIEIRLRRRTPAGGVFTLKVRADILRILTEIPFDRRLMPNPNFLEQINEVVSRFCWLPAHS